ncbi:MAG: T9SS type A sorting domain-containing protein, partial [Bacteroidota bacterium]
PETIEFLGPYDALGLPETLLDPVVLSTSEINQAIEGGINPDWESLASIRGQYVRIEDASIISRTIAARPTWYVSSDGNETVVNIYDTSLRYRNDRGSYSETEFNVRTSEDGDFVPPPPGASVNLQGFLTFPGSGATDSDGRGIPAGRLLSINPMDDDDLEITETPPIITALSKPEGVPGTDPVDVTVEVDADPTRSVAEVTLVYSTTTNPEEQALAMSLVEGAVYEATIPAAADGDFVTYYVEAEDNTGARSASSPNVYRVLSDGITEIAHIQETPSGGPGDSPFLGTAVPMDITVTVQAAPGFGGSAVGGFPVQDDPLLGPWSGVMIRDAEVTAAWNVGDVVRITEAEILENFGVTSLRDLVAEKVGEGDPLPHKTVTTDLLRDNSIAEAHEGMMLRFEDVTVTNPDAGFGEWQFSSDGTAGNAVRADDASDAFSSDFASTSFEEGTELEYLQGLWWFSFSNYKLVPVELDDVGFLTSVEPGEIASRFALSQNYPNPFNPATLIEYSVPAAGKVTLEVFDMLGRKVATLVDGQMPAGVHGITFEAAGLSSGLYLYRLSAGNHVATRTMMLIK